MFKLKRKRYSAVVKKDMHVIGGLRKRESLKCLNSKTLVTCMSKNLLLQPQIYVVNVLSLGLSDMFLRKNEKGLFSTNKI
jgi:hypothetical protein